MIKVQVSFPKGKFEYLKVQGHAGSGPYGHDLVCAGVSSVIIGGLNNLQKINAFDINLAEGLAVIKAKAKITKHDSVVLETIVQQLETIEESHSNHIKIYYERSKK